MSDLAKCSEQGPCVTVDAAFEAGWRTAANWMERDDLIADIGSPAYEADKLAALRSITQGPT